MKPVLTVQDMQELFSRWSAAVAVESARLCELDAAAGDGDHGLSLSAGMAAAARAVAGDSFETPDAVLQAAAEAIMSEMTGAIGPVLVAFFAGGAAGGGGETELDAAGVARWFGRGLAAVQAFGGARTGDKTLVDALAPAAAALAAATQAGLPLPAALAAAAAAARSGAEATRALAARRGRARFLPDKGVGLVDPGAVSMSLLVQTMADFVR